MLSASTPTLAEWAMCIAVVSHEQIPCAIQQSRTMDADSIEMAFRFFADRTAAGFSLPKWAPTPSNLAYRAAVDQLDDVIYDLIRTRRAELSATGPAPQVGLVPLGRRCRPVVQLVSP